VEPYAGKTHCTVFHVYTGKSGLKINHYFFKARRIVIAAYMAAFSLSHMNVPAKSVSPVK